MNRAFLQSLASAGKPIHARFVLRRALIGLGVGLLGGSILGAAATLLRVEPRAAVVGAAACVGTLAGLVSAHRRRLTLHELSLYLDAKLETREALSTALDVSSEQDEISAFIVDKAATLLVESDLKAAQPRIWSKRQASIPLGLGLAIAVCLVEPAPLPQPIEAAPGSEPMTEAVVPELERVIEALDQVVPRDAAQEKRLQTLSDKAKQLKAKLKNGASKREVQAELAELSQGVLAEKLSFGEGEERSGLERALGKLDEPSLAATKQALKDRDLTELDDETSRLANQLEKESREKARQALEEAAKAAKEEGSETVAKELERQAKKLKEEGDKADSLKNAAEGLREQLSEQGKANLDAVKNEGDPEAKRQLAKEVQDILSKMSEAERKALVEKLRTEAKDAASKAKQPDDGSAEPTKPENSPAVDPETLKKLAEQLENPQGKKQLEDALKELANAPSNGAGEATNQELLEQAQQALKEAHGKASGDGKAENSNPDAANGSPDAGLGGSATKKRRKTPSPISSGKSLKARANAPVRDGATLPTIKTGRAGSRPGEVANRVGSGALGQVSAEEVSGVSRSDVPEEYREQVGRYFEP